MKMKKLITIFLVVIAVIVIGFGSLYAVTEYSINQISKITFEDMLVYTTKNNKDAIITVGIIQNGSISYTIYGKNGETLPQKEHIYEIGSITKTITVSLLFKAIDDGKIKLDDNIDKYLDLPQKDYYPTIRRLITHTSGYKNQYLEKQIIFNFLKGRNAFYCISNEQLINRIGKINLKDKDYNFSYSNFGISIIGAVLSEIYGKDFTVLINDYAQEEFGLTKTIVSDSSGNLDNYWDWANNDVYIPAGALTSTIEDMLKYAQLQIHETPEYILGMQKALVDVNKSSARNNKINMHIDSIGAAWIIDNHNDIIWHNGGTGHFNSYLGFDRNNKTAVVVLSNLPPNYRIPATIMGIKLLIDLRKETDKNN